MECLFSNTNCRDCVFISPSLLWCLVFLPLHVTWIRGSDVCSFAGMNKIEVFQPERQTWPLNSKFQHEASCNTTNQIFGRLHLLWQRDFNYMFKDRINSWQRASYGNFAYLFWPTCLWSKRSVILSGLDVCN